MTSSSSSSSAQPPSSVSAGASGSAGSAVASSTRSGSPGAVELSTVSSLVTAASSASMSVISATRLLGEHQGDELPERQVQEENEGDHDDQGGQHHRCVVDELGSGGPLHQAHLVPDLAAELQGRRPLAARRPFLRPRSGGLLARGRAPCGRGPIGLRLALSLHHALGFAVHGFCLTSLIVGHGVLRASSRAGGTRTPNRRFWRPVLYQLSYCPRWVAICIGGGRFSPLTWGTASQSSTGRAKIAQRVSLCTVCWRSHRQNFFISIRSRSLSLFLVVM